MASTTVGNLVTKLTAITNPFAKGMAKAQSITKRFGAGVAAVGARVAKLGAALTATAAGATALLVRSQLKAIDSATKMADRLGVATEALVGLRHAAKLSGVEASQLDIGLQRMTRRIAEAAQGAGEAQGAIAELGLDAGRLAQLSPDEQFKRIADAMQGVGNQSDRVRLGFKLFDSEGVALINTMRGGADAIRAAEAEAKRLGIAFTRIDAAKVEAANDAITRFKALISGAARVLTVELAPFIEAATNKLLAMATAGGSMGDRVTGALESVAVGLAQASRFVDILRAAWNGLQGVIGGWVSLALTGLQKVAEGIEYLARELGDVDIQISKTLGHLAEGFGDTATQNFRDMADAWDDAISGRRVDEARELFKKIREDAQKTAEAVAGTSQSLGDITDKQTDAQRALGDIGMPKFLKAGSGAAVSFINQQRMNEKVRTHDRDMLNVNRDQLDELQGIRQDMQGAGDAPDELVVAF